MWIGFWPPSKRARRLAPEREPQPFWPRPAVLPVPEPSPRPTRLRGRREPGAGLRLCRPIRSVSVSGSAIAVLLDLDEVADLVDHPTQLGGIRVGHRVTDPAQTER